MFFPGDPSYQSVPHRVPCMGSPPGDTRMWYGADKRWYVGEASQLGSQAGAMRAAVADEDGPVDEDAPPHPATVTAWEVWEPGSGRWAPPHQNPRTLLPKASTFHIWQVGAE